MSNSPDGCLSRTQARDKKASGILVYLLEELGDARLRTAQLKQYVKQALDLVEESSHRDHFYEVAAHLIHGIPDTMFKLDKALDAAAMAASRMDYEEIKQELKPEKAEELERVLEDVRLHYLKRRSSMNARDVAAFLDHLATATRQAGRLPTRDLARLIGDLDGGSRTASADVATRLASMAEQLRQKANPSRRELAAALRSIVADAMEMEAESAGSDEPTLAGAGEQFKKVNPDISDEAVKKIDEMHEEHKDVVKEKHAAESAAITLLGGGVSEAKIAYKVAQQGNDRMAAVHGISAVQHMTSALASLAPEHGDKIAQMGEKASRMLSAVKSEAGKADVLQRGVESAILTSFQNAVAVAKQAMMAAAQGKDAVTVVKSVESIEHLTAALAGIAPEHGDKLMAISALAARMKSTLKGEAAKADVLQRGGEQGLSRQQKIILDRYIASSATTEVSFDALPSMLQAALMQQGSYPDLAKDVTEYLEDKAFRMFSAGKTASSLSEEKYEAILDWFLNTYNDLGEKDDPVKSLTRETGNKALAQQLYDAFKGLSSGEKSKFFRPSVEDKVQQDYLDKWLEAAGYKASKTASTDPVEADGLDDACWEGYEAYGLKPGEGGEMVPNCVPVKTAAGHQNTASTDPVAEEWKAARFEKGKPADPTENMTPEDAAEWKAMTEEHKDQFKTARVKRAARSLWHIYDIEGWEKVEKEITHQVEEAKHFLSLVYSDGSPLQAAYKKFIAGVLKKYQDFGTYDSEVYGAIMDALKRHLKSLGALTAEDARRYSFESTYK